MISSPPSSKRALRSATSVCNSRSSGIGFRSVHSHAPGNNDARLPELYPPLPLSGGPQNRRAILMNEDIHLQHSRKNRVTLKTAISRIPPLPSARAQHPPLNRFLVPSA